MDGDWTRNYAGMDGDWTRNYAGMDRDWTRNDAGSAKGPVITSEQPSLAKNALRQLGKTKPKVKADLQTSIPVVQQGTGPFGNEYDPTRSYPALHTHKGQNGRLCLLVSATSLLFLGVGCIITCYTGAGILDSSLTSSCAKFGNYWKYRCLPIDSTSTIPSGAVGTASNCVSTCKGNNLSTNNLKRCIKRCTEYYPNYENELQVSLFQTTVTSATSWGQQDPLTVCQNSGLNQKIYGAATWSSIAPKSSLASDWHWAVSQGCWSAGVLGFIFGTLGAGLFGLFGAIYTDFSLGETIFKGISSDANLCFVGGNDVTWGKFQDFWINRLRPTCHQTNDMSQLLWMSDCIGNVPLCRMWEENYYMIFAVFIAVGVLFILTGLVMFFGGVYLIFYPVVAAKKTAWNTASFSPMVGGSDSIAQTMSLPEQAQRLHTNLTGRPGHLPLTYTIQLPHKTMEELYRAPQ